VTVISSARVSVQSDVRCADGLRAPGDQADPVEPVATAPGDQAVPVSRWDASALVAVSSVQWAATVVRTLFDLLVIEQFFHRLIIGQCLSQSLFQFVDHHQPLTEQ
jgi:hypothetical protein